VLVAAAESAKAAVIVGASFIGLEVAASLRARGIEVHVAVPMRKSYERFGRSYGGVSSALTIVKGSE